MSEPEDVFIIQADPCPADGFADWADNFPDACAIADDWAAHNPGTTITVINDEDVFGRILYTDRKEPRS